jgi:aminopeptidase-like protein
LELIETPSGTQVFDWTVPKEWVVREAYIIGPNGDKVVDVADHTLHLVNYSAPFHGTLSRAELDEHLFSLPDQPDAIPYVTSYYSPRWGFCLSEAQRKQLVDGEYRVVVDTEFIDGSLTIGECVLPGECDQEVLISTNICHPSLANNELSGPLVSACLARLVASWPKRNLTYRFVFLPETIGSLTYLAREGERLKSKIVAGYQIVCVGTDKPFLFKMSRQENSLADRAALTAMTNRFGEAYETRRFAADWGSDERQYCSPGFDLPLGSIIRSIYDEYPEYHTSLDNKSLLSFPAMAETVEMCEFILKHLDFNRTYVNQTPCGELQLGKRGLYPTLGNYQENMDQVSAMLWLLNLSDGDHDLLAVAERSGVDIRLLHHFAQLFTEMGLLRQAA